MLLVTGITGHTGKYFVDELIKNNYQGKIRCILMDEKDSEKLKNSKLNFEIVYGDLADNSFLDSVCKDVDEILQIYNIKYSINMINTAIKNNVKRIICVHTTGIYSKYKMASSEYKEIEEKAIKIAKNKIDLTILRPTMIYGDICDQNISKFIKMVDKLKVYPMIAGGKAEIHPVNARDLGKAYYQVLMNSDTTRNKNYNMSGSKEIKIIDMLKLIGKHLNKKTIFINIPLWISVIIGYFIKFITFNKINIVEKILRMDESRCFSHEDAKKDFGYDPIDFEEAIEIEVKQYINAKNKQEESNENIKKVLFTATVDSHILHFHIPYLKLFKDSGYEVHVATNGEEKIPYCDVKYKISFERSPYKINNIKAIKQLKRVLNKEKFDIIHTHTPMGAVVTRIAAKKTRKENNTRVIYTAHGFHFYKGASLFNWLVFYPIEKALSKHTDVLITINKEDYNLARDKFKKTRVEYVPGVGVDPQKFDFEITEEEKEKLRKDLGCNKESVILIFPAELNENKNQGMLIKAMEELVKENDNIHLLLPGIDSLNGKYQQEVKELNLQNNIHFLGYRKDIPKLLKISNLAVSSSRREGLPINIIEAMFCGLPCVVTKCRGNSDLIKNEINGFIVDVDDVGKLNSSIKKICENKIDIQKSNKKALREYISVNIQKKIKKIYKLKNYKGD